jgi:hypothetical protein
LRKQLNDKDEDIVVPKLLPELDTGGYEIVPKSGYAGVYARVAGRRWRMKMASRHFAPAISHTTLLAASVLQSQHRWAVWIFRLEPAFGGT